MKVIYLYESNTLTPGKVYDAELINMKSLDETIDGMYRIVNDNNRRVFYYVDRFITLEEHREEQLNKILKQIFIYIDYLYIKFKNEQVRIIRK